MNDTVVFRDSYYRETGEILIVTGDGHVMGAPDPETVRVSHDPHPDVTWCPWRAIGAEGSGYYFPTEREAVAWATEDGSGWTPADETWCPSQDWPAYRVVLTVVVNEPLEAVAAWPWYDMLNMPVDSPTVEVTVESTTEVAR